MKKYFTLYLILVLSLVMTPLNTQQCPSPVEKVPFLVTFAKNSSTSWGDDDFVQVLFFVVPKTEKNPIFFKIFDPESGGKNDEVHAGWNSKTRYTIYGGAGTHSEPDARKQDPVGKYKSGVSLFTKTFESETTYDDKWFTMGPFNPVEGELSNELGGYVFKIVVEGLDGDDGNLYRLFMSSNKTENIPIEGGNSFTYEYSIRLSDTKGAISHLYPFITSNIVAVKLNVFDYDNDGIIRTVSVAKKGIVSKSSADAVWVQNVYDIVKEEHNTSMDIQFLKQNEAKNNNIVVYITNQYDEAMPFYTSPIGGIPKFKFKIGVKVEDK